MATWNDVISCAETRVNEDLTILNEDVVVPLVNWWKRQGVKIQAFVTTLLRSARGIGIVEKAAAVAALRAFLLRVLGLTVVELIDIFLDALLGALVGLSLAILIDVIYACMGSVGF